MPHVRSSVRGPKKMGEAHNSFSSIDQEIPDMNRAFATLIVLLLAAFQIASAQTRPNPRDGYMGDDACRSCHALQVDSFHKTAHFLTSSEPNQHSILGKFTSGGFFQTANSRTERFAFVIGSGDKGQTYLFCHMPGRRPA